MEMSGLENSSNTLYINNINEKIHKKALKKLLYMLFSQYGKVIQITASKGIKMRGQAWIVFKDATSASTAMKGKSGFKLYGKELKIQFAKEKSHIIARKAGETVVKSTKRSRDQVESSEQNDNQDDDDVNPAPPKKKEAVPQFLVNNTPNRILFAQNLAPETSQDALLSIFAQCQGFLEIRLVAGRGVAFIEFESEVHAGIALRQFNGLQITPTRTIHLTYGN